MGALFVGILFYLALLKNGVDPKTAIRYALFSAIFMELTWLVGPILGIQLMIERMILKKIRYITDLMNRVSMGEIDASPQIEGNDEISELADAFERMRLSIKALYKRVG
jgi:HAMP domain-containing protein